MGKVSDLKERIVIVLRVGDKVSADTAARASGGEDVDGEVSADVDVLRYDPVSA